VIWWALIIAGAWIVLNVIVVLFFLGVKIARDAEDKRAGGRS
jgi:hypothetical protein